MNFTDFLLLASQAEVDVPSLFPFPLPMHIGLGVFAFLFLILRFAKEKYPYQLIIAVAAPLSLFIHISNEKSWFYFIGVVEGILLLAAFISTFIVKRPKEESKEKKTAEETK